MEQNKKTAYQLIVLFGVVSLFGDMIYEGARSVNGPYLKVLAANAALVGLIAGVGELIGYALRLVSGYLSDKTKSYWLLTFLGYGILATVPLLALAGTWQLAAMFIVLERLGKAIRSPARDTILSQASSQVGTGFGFGLHEAMDQIGALSGPLIFTAVFMILSHGNREANLSDYQKGYSFLWIPFLFLMGSLILAYKRLPNPAANENATQKIAEPEQLSKAFWQYTIFTFFATLGFANFVLISYHFKATGILSDSQIPFFYAIAMGLDAVVALAVGKFYDVLKEKRKKKTAGLKILIIVPVATLFITIFAFSKSYVFAFLAACLWGVVMGIHETIMRSAIADITPLKKRGTGYGIFNTSYGIAMFLGSSLMGLLYDYSIASLITASIVIEVLAFGIFLTMRKSF